MSPSFFHFLSCSFSLFLPFSIKKQNCQISAMKAEMLCLGAHMLKVFRKCPSIFIKRPFRIWAVCQPMEAGGTGRLSMISLMHVSSARSSITSQLTILGSISATSKTIHYKILTSLKGDSV